MNASVTELPFNRLLGMEASEDESAVVRLPEGGQYLNHLGTVHAGALLAIAEAASGEWLLRRFGVSDGLVAMVRRLEAKFRKPAHGVVAAAATVSAEAWARLENDLATKGRGVIALVVEVRDPSGIVVLSATVEWFLQRAGKAGKA